MYAFAAEEHMLCPAETHTFCAEGYCLFGVLGVVGVGSHLKPASLVCPGHKLGEIAGNVGENGGNYPRIYVTGGAVY